MIPASLGLKQSVEQAIASVLSNSKKHLCSVGVVLTLFLSPALVFAADKPLTAVADLRYGVALYNYYQNKNLQALTELLVAQKRDGIQGHGDNPEIMEGGFSMAYGMERKASEIFERLLDSNRPQRIRDAAWYNLAKMRYLRQDWTATEQALGKVEGEGESHIAVEEKFLRFNLAIQQGHLEEAEVLLADASLNSQGMQPYMHFNIAAAYSRQGEYSKGIEHYKTLLTMSERDPEFLALYDKAMTAAGYSYLLSKDYQSAIDLFTKVRLDSPLSNRALLGYGWAASEQEDYLLALKSWNVLAKRSIIDENTQEVLVAIPYAYEKMGRDGLALKGFRAAESNYLAEMDTLDEVINSMKGYAIREALNIDRSTDINWLSHAQENKLSPRLTYLIELFSREEFIGLVQELRDLLAIQVQFKEWQSKLVFYGAMLDEREKNRAAEVDYVIQQDLDKKITDMTLSRDAFAAEIADLQAQPNFLKLVDPESAAKLKRILSAEKNVELLNRASRELNMQVMPAEELNTLSETLRAQKGFMIWKSQSMYDERLWRSKYELAQVNEALNSMRLVQGRVQKVVGQGFDLQPLRARMATANEQLLMQNIDIEHAVERSQDALREQVLRVLLDQRVRLKHYLAQSRLSIARLLDRAQEEEKEVHQEDDGLPEEQEGVL